MARGDVTDNGVPGPWDGLSVDGDDSSSVNGELGGVHRESDGEESSDAGDDFSDDSGGEEPTREDLSGAEDDASDDSDSDEFSRHRFSQDECEQYVNQDVPYACREGERAYLIQKVVQFVGESQTQICARKDVLYRFSSSPLGRLTAAASGAMSRAFRFWLPPLAL